jgi:hypothetical protein
MRYTGFMTRAQSRLAWLLALALLLPLTQSIASSHLLSHVQAQAASDAHGKPVLHVDHCDLCLTAGVLLGGALPAQSLASAPALLPFEAPAMRASSVWQAAAPRLYQSRAPPSFRF